MYQVIEPVSEEDYERYYQFRWEQLRSPFNLPKGSEKDEYDQYSEHRMILDKSSQPIAVGRLYQISADEAQIRYMAVSDAHRGKGIGSSMIAALEDLARSKEVKRMMMNARIPAVPFYLKNGYHPVGEGPTHFGKIKHQQMQKDITPKSTNRSYGEWCDSLAAMWRDQIPLSAQMGVTVDDYTGESLKVTAPVTPNVNLHGGMFAGSLYAMGCLTGWGLLYLMLKERNITARIMLVNGDIRYVSSVVGHAVAEASRKEIEGSIWPLIRDKKVVMKVPVNLYSGEQLAAQFTGKFILYPASDESFTDPMENSQGTLPFEQ
ncbi:bifunctional GNAT family N-acetyltransferase/hotdog fold thioesterase [Echinimonas agarilytica]|uniref:Bifunctional GNAT family N-acetyltransferase/hotdog fold thioesterase n=1 Tax=Echinimonas agarilytica TaxID=1215918 RepID=A0AA42B8J1_9GAMM|nr:bifunctional GNAT family N-acetyltransferase/hotdog fold thioesterase [Echinimonas agarilytica]MCM2681009.1 bifunctional GNAT family N-acetyltransferase/hotdog fold thioesterase [Echinimonas agarilytica]